MRLMATVYLSCWRQIQAVLQTKQLKIKGFGDFLSRTQVKYDLPFSPFCIKKAGKMPALQKFLVLFPGNILSKGGGFHVVIAE